VAGRFPLLTDESVDGPFVLALARHGWESVRAIDMFGEMTDDEALFAYAAAEERVFVTEDRAVKAIAERWLREGRRFRGLIILPQQSMSAGEIAQALDELATEDDPFSPYPIVYIRPKR
jgi:predicted nuclease of predicted toxin-antitoxin system